MTEILSILLGDYYTKTNLGIVVFPKPGGLVVPVGLQTDNELAHLLDPGSGTGPRVALRTADFHDNLHDTHGDAGDESAQSRVPAVRDALHFQVEPEGRINQQVPDGDIPDGAVIPCAPVET